MQTCFRTLLYENEGMRHIFLEEAAEYCPQKVQDGETDAEVEKLVRMGGNASLAITLINQRARNRTHRRSPPSKRCEQNRRIWAND
ncbi:MAG TPA: hypothetical protein VM692_08525 [Gammaproteobacteria bacterium]|nr:hypothetical protein [Gammaproteobacteria bacterium]